MMPAVLGLAADAMSMTTEEFLKQMELGAIKSKEFLPLFTDALREMAAPGLDKAFKTMNVAFKRMVQNAKLFVKALFESGIGDLFTSIFDSLSNIFKVMSPIISLFGGFLTGILKPIVLAFEFITWLLAEMVGLIDKAFGGKLNSVLATIGEIAGFIATIVGGVGRLFAGIAGLFGKIWKYTPSGMLNTSLKGSQGIGGDIVRGVGSVAGKVGRGANRVIGSGANRAMAVPAGAHEAFQSETIQKIYLEPTGEGSDLFRQAKKSKNTSETLSANIRR